MDPASIVSIIEGSISLIVQCASVIKILRDISQKHKRAKLAITSIVQEVDSIELASSKIKAWSQSNADNPLVDHGLLERLERSLENGTVVISALQDDLAGYTKRTDTFGFRQRSRAVRDEQLFRDHQDRIRGQAMAMSLLLHVLNLPTASDRNVLLRIAVKDFDESDESAKSIIPSRMSISTYRCCVSVESAKMSYRYLSFEDDLFTAHVYKRNYRTSVIDTSLQQSARLKHQERLKEHRRAMADRAFLYACAVGDHQTVKKLLDDGQDVHAQSDDIRGNCVLVTWPKTSGTRFHAIHLAAATNDLETAKTLLEYGADVNQVLGLWALRPLHIAAYFDSLPMVELLLRNGANVYAEDFECNQAIHFAAFSGATQIVYELLHSRSRLDCANIRGQTPSDHAQLTPPINSEAFQSHQDHPIGLFPLSKMEYLVRCEAWYFISHWEFVFLEPEHQAHPSITISCADPFKKPEMFNQQQATEFWKWKTQIWQSHNHLKPITRKVAPIEGQELRYGVVACKELGY